MYTRDGLVATATELKQNFGTYMALIEQQQDVVITKNGARVARLIPYNTGSDQHFLAREEVLDYQHIGKKVTYGDFVEICSKTELRLEFINGEIYALDSPSITHQELLGRLHLIFHAYLRGNKCRVFLAPFDVHFRKKDIEEPDVLQPDLLVVCDLEGNVTENDRYMGTPALVVEIVSRSTRTKDMIDKLNTYRLSGVKEYWIVDPKQENVIVYRLKDHEIENYRVYGPGTTATSLCFQGLEADVGGLFCDAMEI